MIPSGVTSRSPATLADLESLPEGIKGELIDGVLYTQARPCASHQDAIGAIHTDLDGPFRRGRGGPGGWRLLVEPGLTAPGAPEYSPDIAGWRQERLPSWPQGRIPVIPDWICEVLSPSTRRYDLVTKRRFYARIGVAYLWYVDVDEGALTASRLAGEHWMEIGSWGPGETFRAEPFDAIDLSLDGWLLPAP